MAPAMEVVSSLTGRPVGHSVRHDYDYCGSSLHSAVVLSRSCRRKLRKNRQPDWQKRHALVISENWRQLTFNIFGVNASSSSICRRRTMQSAGVAVHGRWKPCVSTIHLSEHCGRSKQCGDYLATFQSRCPESTSYSPSMPVSPTTLRVCRLSTFQIQAPAFQRVAHPCKRRRSWMQQVMEDNQALVEDQDWAKNQRSTESVDGEDRIAQAQKLLPAMVESTNTKIVDMKDNSLPPEGFIVFMSCVIGLLTGVCIVLFNRGVRWIQSLIPLCEFCFFPRDVEWPLVDVVAPVLV